jgi:hypothetical protein
MLNYLLLILCFKCYSLIYCAVHFRTNTFSTFICFPLEKPQMFTTRGCLLGNTEDCLKGNTFILAVHVVS